MEQENKKPELTPEEKTQKSHELADLVIQIALPVHLIDVEFCKQSAKDMMNQASRQESMAILNPSHSQIKNDILRKKGEALKCLAQYAECLKEIQTLKEKLEKEEKGRAEIAKLFT